MRNHPSNRPALISRTPRMVGREAEADRLRIYLHARGERNFVYIWASGGLGKTRLLEELQLMVKEAGAGFYSTGIIDLYHTDIHSSSDVERAIVDGLDPAHKYFGRYRQERAQFELLRERGTDPGVLERRREKLSELFILDCREMALDAHKLVICFDTVELLQYESSVVEERVGAETVDSRLRPWLLSKLAPLANVLIVFAGRPKARSHEETLDHQARLINDLQKAFGEALSVVELQPFTLAEARSFIEVLTRNEEVIPADYLPIVHRLTGGRPIFLHLVMDLAQVLALELSRILNLFNQYRDLVDVSEEDKRLQQARTQIEIEILRALLNEGGELGEYLRHLALMPKGVDPEILQRVLGLPFDEAEQLLASLAPLSFVKRYKAPPGSERLHSEGTFLHDEMYQLLTKPEIIPRLRVNERVAAHGVITNYYDPHINNLEKEIKKRTPEERIALRERLQKLQVERLYYLLVRDPKEGYAEYQRLSDQANRHRWVGFSMRLLDEFLRFYNDAERRKLFETAGISHEQVIRESTQMWVERFYWWGQRERMVQFAQRVLDKPDIFSIDPVKHVAILGNICALWASTRAVLHGLEPEVVQKAEVILACLPTLADCPPEQILARARLATAIGYQFRLGGLLAKAAAQYAEANAAFRKLKDQPEELAMLLNNLAYTYAKQGRMNLAPPLAHEALQINEAMGNEYSTGLTLSTLAAIERMRGNYSRAVEHGEEALSLFRELQDAHGIALAYLGIAQAKRRMAKYAAEMSRRLEEAHQKLEEARRDLSSALEVAQNAELGSDMPALYAEQGRVYRELGHIVTQLEGLEKGLVYYRQSEDHLRKALVESSWGQVDQADTLQDLAEVLFDLGDRAAAEKCLKEIEEMMGSELLIVPGQHVPLGEGQTLTENRQHFAPLGKMEMLRGQMAFSQGKLEAGLHHFLLAHAYFMRFSPNAIEQDTLVEYLYNKLRDLPVERQQALGESTRQWIEQHEIGVDIRSFMQILNDLLGV